MNRTSNARKPNSAAISHPSLLTACQMALAVTSGLSSGLVTHYINAHGHRNLRKEALMLRVGATGTKQCLETRMFCIQVRIRVLPFPLCKLKDVDMRV
jgi:hypothetical protein